MVFDLMIDVEGYEDNLLYEPVDITLECLKYTSNLLVRNILNPEIERASEELSDVIDVHAIDIFYMLQKDLLVKNRQALMWLLHDGTNCDIIAQIQNINKQILQFDATQELQKGLVYYTWDLQKWKMELLQKIISHDTEYYSHKTLLRSFHHYFTRNYTFCFESYENIIHRLYTIVREVERVEKKFQKIS